MVMRRRWQRAGQSGWPPTANNKRQPGHSPRSPVVGFAAPLSLLTRMTWHAHCRSRPDLSTTQTTSEFNSGGAHGSDTLVRATHPNHRGQNAAVILLRDASKTVRGHDFVFYQSSMTESPRG